MQIKKLLQSLLQNQMINGSEWKKRIDPNDLGLEIDTKRLKREREKMQMVNLNSEIKKQNK